MLQVDDLPNLGWNPGGLHEIGLFALNGVATAASVVSGAVNYSAAPALVVGDRVSMLYA